MNNPDNEDSMTGTSSHAQVFLSICFGLALVCKLLRFADAGGPGLRTSGGLMSVGRGPTLRMPGPRNRVRDGLEDARPKAPNPGKPQATRDRISADVRVQRRPRPRDF